MAESFDNLLRARFRELIAEKEAIQEAARPHREAYDAKWNEIKLLEQTELKPLELAMREAEVGLFDLSNEIAAIARALKGQTGPV